MSRISQIDLDDSNLPPPTPEIEQERKVAIYDLLEENVFDLPAKEGRPKPEGPFHLGLAIRDKRLVFDVQTEDEQKAAEFHLSLSPFRQVVKDYWQICESYFDAVKNMPPSQIETIDMASKHLGNFLYICYLSDSYCSSSGGIAMGWGGAMNDLVKEILEQ